jgi:hypothetical protein
VIDQQPSAAVAVRRQRMATVLAFAGLLIMPIGVAATDNPRNYIYLRLLAHPYVVMFIGLVMVAVAAIWLITSRRLRVAVIVVITLLIGLVGFSRAALASLPFRPPTEVGTVATSNRFRLVEYHYPGFFSPDVVGLRVQSRAGLLSREGRRNVACFAVSQAEPGDEWLLGDASFTDDNTIDITTRDGQHWTASFDPTTLEPIFMVNRCTNAPDPFDD